MCVWSCVMGITNATYVFLPSVISILQASGFCYVNDIVIGILELLK